MKKTLIAIMALAGMATATDEFTGFTFSNTGTGTGLSSMLGFAFTLNATSSDYSVTNTTEFDFPKVLTLTEVSFNSAFVFNKNSKYGQNIDNKNVYLYITDKDNAILDISEAASVVASTDSSNAGGAVTFTLDCANIKAGTEYYAWFMGTDSSYSTTSGSDVKTISFTSGETNNTVELRSYNKLVATTGDLKLLTATDKTSSNNTFAGMTIKAVPEPTTATLSLLALAGLAARRRRK